jgi:uncharacterized protein DUF4105
VASRILRGIGRLLLILPLGLVALGWGAWCAAAIWFSSLPWPWLRATAAVAFVAGSLAWLVHGRFRLRPLLLVLGSCLLVTAGWLLIPASNERNWMPEYSRAATATFAGDRVTIHDLRDFEYRKEFDFTPRWVERSVDLAKIESVDFAVSNWGLADISHTIVSFGFSDGRHVAVSIETRREEGEPQTALRSLFKQYELIYVFADERDLIRLRADFRKETVRLFPLRLAPGEARLLFTDMLERANELAARPEYYNMVTQNCTTSLLPHRARIRPWRLRDLRVLLNGRIDEMLFENGAIDTKLPLEEARARFTVKPGPVDPGTSEEYSRRIRASRASEPPGH